MKTNTQMVQKWWQDPNFDNFLRQAQTDAFVGLKNGVPVAEIKQVAEDFAKKFIDSFNFENKPIV